MAKQTINLGTVADDGTGETLRSGGGKINDNFTELYTAEEGKKVYHGVEQLGALSFNSTTHVVSVASGTNTYWYKGVKYTTSSQIDCDLDSYITLTANTTYFITFDDSTGTLVASTSAWDLKEQVSVCTVFWNGSDGAIIDEKHNHTRNIDWHINAHLTIGTRYYTGLALTYPSTGTPASLQIESGYIFDEDILHTITQQTTARALYQASAGVYTWTNISLPYTGSSGAPTFLDTDTYSLATFASNNYASYWVYAVGDIDRNIYIIPSHLTTAHANLNAARDEDPPSLSDLNLNPEMKILYKFIYSGDGAFSESYDYRSSSSLPSGGVAAIAALGVSFTPTGDISSTNVQLAIQELDTEKQASLTFGIADTNAVKVDGSPNSAEYARFTSNGIEGRTESEFKADFNLEIGTDVLAYSANVLYDNVAEEYTKTQNFDATSTTRSTTGTYTIDLSSNQVHVLTAGANFTTDVSNQVAGATYIIILKQDATGSRAVSWSSNFKFEGGTAPTQSTDANDVSIWSFVSDGTYMYGTGLIDMS